MQRVKMGGGESLREVLSLNVVAVVAGVLTLNFQNQKQRMFVAGTSAAGLAADFAFAISNSNNALVVDLVVFIPASVTRNITFPAAFRFLQSETRFTSGTGVLAITSAAAIEKYEISGTWDGSKWACKIAGPYYA